MVRQAGVRGLARLQADRGLRAHHPRRPLPGGGHELLSQRPAAPSSCASRRWAREFARSAFSAEPEEFADDLLAELLRSGAAQWRDGRLLAQVPHHEAGDEGPLQAPWPRQWPDIATAPADNK